VKLPLVIIHTYSKVKPLVKCIAPVIAINKKIIMPKNMYLATYTNR
jgi:hypothetical protein